MKRHSATVLLLAGFACAASAQQDRFWSNAAGGSYALPQNWQGTLGPGPNDNAFFELTANYTVTFPVTAASATIGIGKGNVVFDFGGVANFNTQLLAVGYFEPNAATFNFRGGTFNADAATIAEFANSPGALSMTASSAQLLVAGSLNVGLSGDASLTVNSGARVTSGDALVASVDGSVSTVTVSGAGSRWTNNGLAIVGRTGDATLTLDAGAVFATNDLDVAVSSQSATQVNISGAATQATVNGQSRFGVSGRADLTVAGGASLTTVLTTLLGELSAGFGTVTVTGTGSRWESTSGARIGEDGEGRLSVASGASATMGSTTFLGRLAGSRGSLIATGANTAVTITGQTQVGDSGEGSMEAAAGAVINVASNILIASNPGSTGNLLVVGPAAVVTATGQVQVGRDGVGELRIENGGRVNASGTGSPTQTAALIGRDATGSGEAVVTGANSLWQCNNGALAVGWSRPGVLTIIAGGRVNSVGGFVGRNIGSSGTARIEGTNSVWDAGAQPIRVGLDPNGASSGTGALELVGGGRAIASAINLGSQGTLTGQGVAQASVTSAGVVAPGVGGIGTLTVQGAYTQQTGGRLLLQLAGATPGSQHDVLQVTGAATIAGTLSATFSGFSPALGQEFAVLNASSLTRTFSTVTAAGLPSGTTAQAIYGPAGVRLRIVAGSSCVADINGDGFINFLDLAILLANFTLTGPSIPGDINADGTVNFLDLAILLDAFGQPC